MAICLDSVFRSQQRGEQTVPQLRARGDLVPLLQFGDGSQMTVTGRSGDEKRGRSCCRQLFQEGDRALFV
jgi:hypothetical protein